MADVFQSIIEGIDKAAAGDWQSAHAIAQSLEGDPHGDWLHAIVHKIEGDEANSRYWYRKTTQTYETYPDIKAELSALRAVVGG